MLLWALAVTLLVALSAAQAPNNSTCSTQNQRGTDCVNSWGCEWCASTYSCIPSENDLLCQNECTLCESDAECALSSFVKYPDVFPPPVEHDYVCYHGGARVWGSDFPFPDDHPNQRFGGERCVCGTGWTGHDCSICNSDSTCDSSQKCNRGWIPTEEMPNRHLACYCNSNLCDNLLQTSKDQATVSFDSVKTSTDYEGVVSIHKAVPLPSDLKAHDGTNQRQSVVFLKARISQCQVSQSVNCDSTACEVGTCTKSAVPWSSSSLCDVWTCQKAELLCPTSTLSPLSNERYDFYSEVCTNELLKQALQPPFSVACVVDDDSTKDCSFATSLFGHGALTLTCDVGECSEVEDKPIDPVELKVCGGMTKSACEALKYSAILIMPLLISVGLVAGCFFTQSAAAFKHDKKRLVDDVEMLSPGVVVPSDPLAGYLSSNNTYLKLACRSLSLDVETSKPKKCRRKKSSLGNTKKTVLRSISLVVGGSDLMAIIGPSGSGKTSLMDILAGRKTEGDVSGALFLGGSRVSSALVLRKHVGYVLQDDVLHATSTVREYLTFRARLQGDGRDIDTVKSRVDLVLLKLGLKHCADTPVGGPHRKGASGGERRRVSIGVELLAGKSLILMDEPTSGLDSTSSMQVITALKNVVASGTGVCVSIHQPSARVFSQFDKVALLSKLGQLVYFGPVLKMRSTFADAEHSPIGEMGTAEHALDIVTLKPQGEVEQVLKHYQSTEIFEAEVALNDEACRTQCLETFSMRSKNFGSRRKFEAFFALCGRFASNIVRHPVLPTVHVTATIGVSLAAMLLYFDLSNDLGGAINRAGFFFFMITYLTLSALADLGVWQEERVLFIRERASGCYDSFSFLTAKILCEIVPLRLVPIVVSSLILTFGIGLQSQANNFFVFSLVLFLVSISSAVLFLVVGFSFRAQGVANFVAVVCALFCLVLSGFLLIDFGLVSSGSSSSSSSSSAAEIASSVVGSNGNDDSNKVHPLKYVPFVLGYLSFLRPAFELLMINELAGLSFSVSLRDSSGAQTSGDSIPLSGDVILAQLALSPDNKGLDVALLLVWLSAFFVAAQVLLEFKVIEKR